MTGILRLVRNRIFIGLFIFLLVIISIMQYHDVRIRRDQCKEQELMTNKKYEQLKLNLNRQSQKSVQVQETLAKFESLSQHYKLLKNEYEDYKEECARVSAGQLKKINELNNQAQNQARTQLPSNEIERKNIEKLIPTSDDRKISRKLEQKITKNFNAQVEISENLYAVVIKESKDDKLEHKFLASESSTKSYINNSKVAEKVFPHGVVPFDSKIDESFLAESKKTNIDKPNGDNDLGAGEEENDTDYEQRAKQKSNNDVKQAQSNRKKGIFQKTNNDLNGYKLKNEVNEDQGKAYQEEMNFQVEDEDDDEYLDHFGRKQG